MLCPRACMRARSVFGASEINISLQASLGWVHPDCGGNTCARARMRACIVFAASMLFGYCSWRLCAVLLFGHLLGNQSAIPIIIRCFHTATRKRAERLQELQIRPHWARLVAGGADWPRLVEELHILPDWLQELQIGHTRRRARAKHLA